MIYIKLKGIAIIIAFTFLLTACETTPAEQDLLDQVAVFTNYDTEVDFSTYKSYAIPTDTISLYSNATSNKFLTAGNSDYARPVVDAIKTNMNNRNFVLKKRNENPDLGINVSLIHDYNIYQQVYYNGGYGGGYYGYGSSYYYPSYVSTTTTNSGILVVEIVDLKNRTPDNKVKVVWTGTLGDVINAIHINEQSVEGINQSFVQSPFLVTE